MPRTNSSLYLSLSEDMKVSLLERREQIVPTLLSKIMSCNRPLSLVYFLLYRSNKYAPSEENVDNDNWLHGGESFFKSYSRSAGEEISQLFTDPSFVACSQEPATWSHPVSSRYILILSLLLLPYLPSCCRHSLFSDQNCLCISHFSHACYFSPCPSPSLYDRNNIR